jgi:hypothetical protein
MIVSVRREFTYSSKDCTDSNLIGPWFEAFGNSVYMHTANNDFHNTWVDDWEYGPPISGDTDPSNWWEIGPHKAHADWSGAKSDPMNDERYVSMDDWTSEYC